MALPVLNGAPSPLTSLVQGEVLSQIAALGLAPTVATSPTREYVSGGGSDRAPSWNWFQQLPTPDDDLENLIGNDIYTRIGNDEQVASSTFLLIMMTLRRELQLDPAFADEDDGSEDFQKAIEVRDFCKRALANLESNRGSIYKTLWEMLYNSMRFGHSIAEVTLESGSDEDALKLLFKYIKVKPNQATAFVVDPHFNVLGLATYSGPWLDWLKQTTVAVESGHFISTQNLVTGWTLIDRDKFAVLSLLTDSNDPRGKSWWRCIYNAWYQKMRRLRQLDLYSQRFGLPIPVGIASQTAQEQYPPGSDGRPDATQPKVTAVEALLSALMGLQAGDALAAPYGTDVKVIQNTNDGGSLAGALHYHDSQIVKGITFQKLATSPDAHQAKASSSVHQDVLGNPVLYLKNMLVSMLRSDVFWPLVRANYGEMYRKYLPKPNLGKIDPEDLANLLTALGNALRSGGLHYSMLPEIWADWGLPPANIQAWMEEIKHDRELIQALGQPATGAGALPGQTQGGKYALQEVGKDVTRSAAKRTGARQRAGFSEDGDPDE